MKTIGRLFLFGFLIASNSKLLLAQWTETTGPDYVHALLVTAGGLFAGTDTSGVFLSTNNGTTWSQTSLDSLSVRALAVSGSSIFAAVSLPNSLLALPLSGLYVSTNNGSNWAQTSLDSILVNCITTNGSNVFAGCDSGGVFLSTNNGSTWMQTNLDTIGVSQLVVSGSNLLAGGYKRGLGGYPERRGVFRSTDNGATWTQASLDSVYVNSFAVIGAYTFAGTADAIVYLSTNSGTSWTQILDTVIVDAFATSGQNLFAAMEVPEGYGGERNIGVHFSSNYGASWVPVNSGLPPGMWISSLAVDGTYLFAGTGGYGLWRRPLSDMITSADRLVTALPAHFNLMQNYPNPFNPSTTIRFSIPHRAFVLLNVFDLLGREAHTLVSEELNAGAFSIRWDATAFPSGVYFYRLRAGNFADTKSLILLR